MGSVLGAGAKWERRCDKESYAVRDRGMSWDKRTTIRRPGGAPPTRRAGMNIVYLGADRDEEHGICAGDTFRLLPGAAITIGASELCEVTIQSRELAPIQALVTHLPGRDPRVALVDISGGSGVSVDGRHAALHTIDAGTEFTLGGQFRFRCQPAT